MRVQAKYEICCEGSVKSEKEGKIKAILDSNFPGVWLLTEDCIMREENLLKHLGIKISY